MSTSTPSTPVHVTDDTFESEVLKSDIPVLVDFWAEWCGPCRMIAPVLDELAGYYAGRLKIVKVDTEQNPRATAAYGVVSIPLLNLYANGELLHSIAGARPKISLIQQIDAVLNKFE